MIVCVCLALLGLACVGFASELLDDASPSETRVEGTASAFLLLLCLAAVAAHRALPDPDDDPDDC